MPTGPHRQRDPNAFRVDKDERKVTILPKGFNITWGNDDRYWNITDNVAELKQVSWLEVTCSTENVELGKKYSVGFNVKLRPDAFGWKGIDVYVMAKVGKSGNFFPMKVSLGDKNPNEELIIPKEPLEIMVDPSTPKEQRSIHLGLYEVWSSKWKGGLQIRDAFIKKVD